MANIGFRATVGRKRLSRGVDSLTVTQTMDARAAMRNIIRRYQRFVHNVEDAMPDAIFNALVPTYNKSQVYVPKDTGALADSGYLEITDFRGKPRVEIGYGGGGDPEYAVKVHETMEYRHKAPTRAKWLQIALEEDEQAIQQRIVAQLRV